jgi:hypothetical protein
MGVEPGSVTLVGGWGVEPESVTLVGGSLGGGVSGLSEPGYNGGRPGQLTCPFIPCLKRVKTPIDYFYRGAVFNLLRGLTACYHHLW